MLTITTTGVAMTPTPAWALSPERAEVREQFAYLSEDEFNDAGFLRFSGNWYSPEWDFGSTKGGEDFSGWDGYLVTEKGQGLVLKATADGRYVIGAWTEH